MAHPDQLDFLIDRQDLRCATWRAVPTEPLKPGQVRLRIDRFALTANNITYAVYGEKLRYWEFFPAPDGFGRMPVWGFADLVESRVDGLAPGERIYGYFPISTELVVTVAALSSAGFSDAAPWRAELSAVYNRYLRVDGDPAFSGRTAEALQAVFRPLFATSFLIDDFLATNQFFGVTTILVASASSKTALGLAYLLKQNRGEDVQVIGLTSAANTGFVEQTGWFDRVVAYAEIDHLEIVPSVFVDMAGSTHVRTAVHERLRDDLRYSCAVGSSHWEDAGRPGDLPGPRPRMFFAPAHVDRKIEQWGVDGYERQLADAWTPFAGAVERQLDVVDHAGRVEIENLYQAVLSGSLSPSVAAMAEMASGGEGDDQPTGPD